MADPDDFETLAAELALGVLEGEERTRALKLKLANPAFAAAVEAWSARLEPLCEDFATTAPPALWSAIDRRLGDQSTAKVVPIERQLRAWRWGTIGSTAIAAGLALVLLFRPVPPPQRIPVEVASAPQQLVVASLDGGASGAWLAANYDPRAGALRIRAIQMPNSQLAPELWIIPEDGVPRSLGFVSAAGVSEVRIARAHRELMHEGATLAITMEPLAEQPHDKPSSAPVAAGKISTI
jgi:anti-sigma-K factor RskA